MSSSPSDDRDFERPRLDLREEDFLLLLLDDDAFSSVICFCFIFMLDVMCSSPSEDRLREGFLRRRGAEAEAADGCSG